MRVIKCSFYVNSQLGSAMNLPSSSACVGSVHFARVILSTAKRGLPFFLTLNGLVLRLGRFHSLRAVLVLVRLCLLMAARLSCKRCQLCILVAFTDSELRTMLCSLRCL